MTRHLLTLAWNRKRQNLLLAFEILLAFLVLFAITWTGISLASNWRQPLGFDASRVWSIRVRYARPLDAAGQPIADRAAVTTARLHTILATLEDMESVEAVGAGFTAPYVRAGWNTGLHLADGRSPLTWAASATDGYQETLRIRLVRGRWFAPDDDAAAVRPVVVNERLGRELFGDADPVNQVINLKPSDDRPEAWRVNGPWRVVGVIQDFRYEGELAAPRPFIFHRLRIDEAASATGTPMGPPGVLTIRVREGTTAAFEEVLLQRLQAIAPEWSFEVRPLATLREVMIQGYVAPLTAAGTVVLFLLLMVALGLTGVVWQSVTTRTREFGLRRANGATMSDVRRQVLAELALLTSLAVILGTALLAQLPLVPLPGPAEFDLPSMQPPIFVSSIAASAAVIYLLTLLCGWYPSHLATRIQPADALHYE